MNQIGRTAWLKSADGQSIDYPELKKLKEVSSPGEMLNLTQKFFQSTSSTGAKFHDKPLEGYVVADFSNVLAGPNCGRMLCELGATVYKVYFFGIKQRIFRPQYISTKIVRFTRKHVNCK